MPLTQYEVTKRLKPCLDNLFTELDIVAHASYERRVNGSYIAISGFYSGDGTVSLEEINKISFLPEIFDGKLYPVVSSFCVVGESD